MKRTVRAVSRRRCGPSRAEELLALEVRAMGLPAPVREYRFAEYIGRQWRFDFAWPAYLVACEVEGGTFLPGGGRHNRGAGYEADCEKYSTAAIEGWSVVRVTGRMVTSGAAVDLVGRALAARGLKTSTRRAV